MCLFEILTPFMLLSSKLQNRFTAMLLCWSWKYHWFILLRLCMITFIVPSPHPHWGSGKVAYLTISSPGFKSHCWLIKRSILIGSQINKCCTIHQSETFSERQHFSQGYIRLMHFFENRRCDFDITTFFVYFLKSCCNDLCYFFIMFILWHSELMWIKQGNH